jgi:hypothetical protein
MLIRFGNRYDEIQRTCPKIISLDLSRNLFSSLSVVAEICAPLRELRTLRLTGNRFSHTLEGKLQDAFAGIEWLALNMCALNWDEVFLCLEVDRRLRGYLLGLKELSMLKLGLMAYLILFRESSFLIIWRH